MRISDWSSDVCSSDLRTVAASFARLGAVSHGFGRRRHDRGNKVMLQYRDPAAGLLCLERVLVELIECGLLELVAGAAGLALLIEANAGYRKSTRLNSSH